MQLNEQLLQQVTTNVCQTMLGLDFLPTSNDINTARQLVASVEIQGSQDYVVKVFAHDQLIANIAEAMFLSDLTRLTEEEIRDAFREIANMIGGNVKGFLGEETDLMLPTFAEANDALDHLPPDSIRTTLICCGHPLTIVFQKQIPAVEPIEELAAS